jgi:hypothetical protein
MHVNRFAMRDQVAGAALIGINSGFFSNILLNRSQILILLLQAYQQHNVMWRAT